MHLEHKAGDKMYIDFTGTKLSLIDTSSGEVSEVEVFVAILGASQLAYGEAVHTQKKEDSSGPARMRSIIFAGLLLLLYRITYVLP